MTTEDKDQDIAWLQEENAALQQKLREVKQRKQEKAAKKAHAKLAKLQEQLQGVNALKTTKDTRAALRQQQMDEIHKLETQLRLSSLELFTGAVTWDVMSAPTLWGPEIDVSIDFVEPGNKPATATKHCPKRLRISKLPFAIGGMRLAYYAVTNAGHRYVAKRLLREAIQPENNVAAFLEDTNAHREAAALASAFGSRCKLHYVGAQMQYGPVYIVQIPCMDEVSSSGQTTVLLLEEYLEGKFTKWNTNTGNVHGTEDPLPQAFSHFTYCKTHKAADGPKLVVDIQGVKDAHNNLYHLTDPAVHFAGGGCCGFGDTNCGTRGIKSFFDSHQCTSMCRSLGLNEEPSN